MLAVDVDLGVSSLEFPREGGGQEGRSAPAPAPAVTDTVAVVDDDGDLMVRHRSISSHWF